MALIKVKYKGLSDVRVMSKKDLSGVGVTVDGDLVWDRSNRHTVVIEGASDALLEVFRGDGTFTVSEMDAESGKDVKNIIQGSVKDDTASTVVDATTGQKSTKKS